MRKVVIAGGGTAGWMTAVAFAKTLGDTVDVTLIESDDIGTIGVGEATIPPMITFNNLLKIDEAEFMRETQATFKLAIAFEGWKQKNDRYIHPFGVAGHDHWTAGFQHFWLNGKDRGHSEDYSLYSLESTAANNNKFSHLPDNRLSYAYHLDSSRYARYLRRISEANGAKRIEGKIKDVELRDQDGHIRGLLLEDGNFVEGDFFVDCTGFRALLIGKALGVEFEDWSHWLPNDSAIAVQTKSVSPPVPYTRSIAHEAGWQWRIPLQHRMGNGIVYCSEYIDQEKALETLLNSVDGDTLTEPNFIRFKTGARKRQWEKNCVAVGLSSGFMEPLESTSIHLIQRNVLRLLHMFPSHDIWQSDIDEFNRQSAEDMDQIKDFLILHYVANNREGEPFWDHVRNMNIPDTLRHRIDLFHQTGRVFRHNDELFSENSWVQVMMGQGIVPQSYHPIATKMRDDEVNYFLKSLRDNVANAVKNMPEHSQFVAQYCASDK